MDPFSSHTTWRGGVSETPPTRASHVHVLSTDGRRNSNLAGEDVAEGRESVVQRLVVDGLVQVLDEHVAHSGLPEGGVSLGPHDSDWFAFDHVEVHGVQGSLG